MAWVDQQHADFAKARSLAVRAAKLVLEERRFTLPEPIYRLRFDAPVAGRTDGVVTVENKIESTLDLQSNATPASDRREAVSSSVSFVRFS